MFFHFRKLLLTIYNRDEMTKLTTISSKNTAFCSDEQVHFVFFFARFKKRLTRDASVILAIIYHDASVLYGNSTAAS